MSCSGAGSIYYTQVDREDMYGKCLFDCHVGTTYEVRVELIFAVFLLLFVSLLSVSLSLGHFLFP